MTRIERIFADFGFRGGKGFATLACSPAIMVLQSSRNGQPWLSLELAIFYLLVVTVLHAHRSNIRKEFFNSNNN